MFLTQSEIVDLTHRERHSAQARVLAALGVPFRVHPVDGYLIVARSAVQSALGGMTAANDEPARYSVNLNALREHGTKAHARRS